MDKCEEMRAQFDRFCDGQLADSGTTQIQAISSLQMKNIRKYFVPGIYSFDIVGFLDTTLLKTGREGYLFTVDGVYYKEFLEKPGHFRYNDVAKTEIILPKPKDNESTLEIRFQNGRWVRLVGYSLYKTAAKQLLDGLCEIAARYPDEDDEDEDEELGTPPRAILWILYIFCDITVDNLVKSADTAQMLWYTVGG